MFLMDFVNNNIDKQKALDSIDQLKNDLFFKDRSSVNDSQIEENNQQDIDRVVSNIPKEDAKEDEGDNEQHQEDQEQDFGDPCRGASNTTEAQYRSDDGDNQESNSPTKHGVSPSRQACGVIAPA